MQTTATCVNGTVMSYDPVRQVIEVHPGKRLPSQQFFLDSLSDLRNHFNEMMLNWSQLAGHQRVNWLVDHEGFDVNPELREQYVEQIENILRVTAMGIYRYGANTLQTAAMGYLATKNKALVNLFPTREKALAAIDKQLGISGPDTRKAYRVDITKTCANKTVLAFDIKHQIMDVSVPMRATGKRFYLETRREVEDHFRDITEAWHEVMRGNKVYLLVDYEHFDVNPAHVLIYVDLARKLLDDVALGAVRYNANLLQSTALRLVTVKSQAPAHLYKTRREALGAVQDMQPGLVEFSLPAEGKDESARCENGIELFFDKDLQILDVHAPRDLQGKAYLFETPGEVQRYLEDVTFAWLRLTGGKPVYWIVDYHNFTMAPSVRTMLLSGADELMRFAAMRLLRYNADLVQATAMRYRMVAEKQQFDLLETREEAIRAVQKYRNQSTKRA